MTLFLGCPVWACEHWRGSLLTRRAGRSEWLRQYSSVFNTVEGNSTFYALPSPDVAKRWAESVPRGFRFSLKVSRTITHEKRLRDAKRELAAFVDVCNVLDQYHTLGPSFVQLPPDFSPTEQDALAGFLQELPNYLPWAVEVRHHDWYDSGPNEQWLRALLNYLEMDTVLFDSRALHSQPPADASEKLSQSRKPNTPHRQTVTGKHPLLRFVGRNHLDDVTPWIEEWAPVIAEWLRQNLSPFVFTHTPDDRLAPEFARRLLSAIRIHAPDLPQMAEWPGEAEASRRTVRQQTLF